MSNEFDISKYLKILINDYDFNMDILSKYLELDDKQIQVLIDENMEVLLCDNMIACNLFNKVCFLYHSIVDEKDFKLNAFLDILISYHKISKKAISKISSVDTKEIEKFLSLSTNNISVEDKYKLAVTVMHLRFFLKIFHLIQ